MILFLVYCFFGMNILSFAPIIAFTSFITIFLLLSGEIKYGILMYLIFMFSAAASYWALHQPAGILIGLITAFFAGIRLFMPTIMAFILLFKTTKISEFMAAFEKFHVPYVVVIPFTVMFRFFPTVKEEWEGIRNAMAFRGIGLGAKSLLLHPVRSAEHILVPLLFSCVNIMDELVAASLARGLDSDKERTCYFDLNMRICDYLLITGSLSFLVLMFVL